MSLHRRAAKRDANEPAIVSALEAFGCIVWRVSGKGLPDLVVFYRRKNPVMGGPNQTIFVADVKGPKERATPAQVEKWTTLVNLGFSVFILRTPEDAQKMLNNALQPWEPKPGVKATLGAVFSGVPRKGDAAKAPSKAEKQAARLRGLGMRAEVVLDGGVPVGMLAEAGYTPPRSKPVDAAKEAETFAPAPKCHVNWCNSPSPCFAHGAPPHKDGCRYLTGPCTC